MFCDSLWWTFHKEINILRKLHFWFIKLLQRFSFHRGTEAEAGKNLCRSYGLIPCSCKGHLVQVAHHHSQAALVFEDLKRERICNISGQPQSQKSVPWCLDGTSWVPVSARCFLFCSWAPLERTWLGRCSSSLLPLWLFPALCRGVPHLSCTGESGSGTSNPSVDSTHYIKL